ncbi:MAG TPA: aldose 1-epimerase family protein [Sphingomonas sp.]|uniref:aldose 1-epimerase family protein n=1 Tax=Sphingomonas sp. TaxID=28214 RepID=UPI002B62BA83|nr:aldose 1-epimerase family protein [Sphingomonas sp.]HMI18931.1 aldose 1-epimerase family protein [Sphingomonas sp.]
MTDMIRIATNAMSAEFSTLGAEMRVLRDEAGRDLLSDGPLAFWTGRAPFLFPIVGAVNCDSIHIDGAAYPMDKHGFARKSEFTVVDHQSDRATFRLEADTATRAHYPFDFRLDINFATAGATLTAEAVLTNLGDVALPASFGFHPAFRWPLPWGGDRADHRLVFAEHEPAPVRRIDTKTGLVLPDPRPTPIEGDTLAPRDDLFIEDALIFDRLNSRKVRFGVPGNRGLEVDFANMPLLGVWTKPGAPFLCIEPWQGLADPVGYDGDFRAKPYVVEVAPRAERRFAIAITLSA